jgi:K+-sensing histidine kinase KdpD
MLPTPVSRLIAVLSAIFVFALFALLLMPKPTASSLEMEIAKALLQLGVVSIVGVATSVLVFEYQRARNNTDKERDLERRKLEYREDLLKSTLSRAMACYSQAKKARRMFRAKGRQRYESMNIDIVVPEEYDRCLETINDAQLELENLARDVRNSAVAFSNADALVQAIRSMETYLSVLVGEYEIKRGTQSLRQEKLMLDDLPELNDFLLPADDSRFKPQLIIPYHKVQEVIRNDLLHPNLPRGDA